MLIPGDTKLEHAVNSK